MRNRILVFIIIVFPFCAFALKALTLPVPIDRSHRLEVFGPNKAGKGKYKRLMLLKQSANLNQFKLCIQRSTNVSRFPALVRDVVYLEKVKCLRQIEKKNKQEWNQIAEIVHGALPSFVSKNWVAIELQSLKKDLLLDLFKNDLKRNRRRAWKSFGKLTRILQAYSSKEIGLIFRTAGELAFLQQRMPIALKYWEQSLSAHEASDLRKKYTRLRQEMGVKEKPSEDSRPNINLDLTLKFDPQEIKFDESIRRALSSGKVVLAFKDFADFSEQFPGSEKLRALNTQIRRAYLRLFGKGQKKFDALKKNVDRSVSRLPVAITSRWISKFYFHDKYLEIVELYKSIKAELVKSPDSSETLMLIGKSAVHVENWEIAKEVFSKVSSAYSGSDHNLEARFRLALVYIRIDKVPLAMSELERLLRLTSKDSLIARTLYWLWRCAQKLENGQANELATRLIKEYPFYYYGIMARAEQNGGVLDFTEPLDIKVESSKFYYSEEQIRIFQKYKILVQAGWLKEAQRELSQLPIPTEVFARMQFVELLLHSLNYMDATSLLIDTWNLEPKLKHPVILQKLFPKEFSSYVIKSSTKWNISPLFIWSIIRQESLFDWTAKSSASAQGLMQIVVPTARDIVGWLRLKNVQLPRDLSQPKLNIEMGTHYFGRLAKKYKGRIPLALVAYNAGPGNADRWLKGRGQLKVQFEQESDPSSKRSFTEDLWVEELPWDETNSYVFRILRNWMVYQVYDQGKVELTRPLWQGVLTK